jgi:hypothetical protein
MVGKKVKCVYQKGDLIQGNVYTVIEVIVDSSTYYRVKEVQNGRNQFFATRFIALKSEMSKRIKIL